MKGLSTRIAATVILSALPAVSCAADVEQPVRARYGEAAYLYAGAGCEIRNLTYVAIDRAKFYEGIHRIGMEEVSGKRWASDVYYDQIAVPSEEDQRSLSQATVDNPVYGKVSGWMKDCGGMNVIFLVDKLQRSK